MNDAPVLGVDRYRRGWVAIVVSAGDPPDAIAAPDLRAIVDRVPGAACVGVDMPIGLPEVERESDVCARRFVGPRRASVFMTPPAEVLAAPTYAEANAIAAQLPRGKKISQQAWALRHTIAEVAEIAAEDPRIIEVHPEVSFTAMRGEHVPSAKTTWNGQTLRRELLAGAGIELPDDLGAAGAAVPPADVLDAAAAAWTARRYTHGEARSLPAGAAPGARGVIWY